MGRPKKVPDEAVLDAVGRAIGRRGPSGFTIRDVAREAGLSPAAVLQRFGSRRTLLLAFAKGGVGRLDAAFAPQGPGAGSGSVADAVVRAFGAGAGEAPSAAEMANHVAMLAEDLADPDLRREVQAHFRRLREGLLATVRLAAAGGELRPLSAAGQEALARTLEAAGHGTLVTWAVRAQGTLEEAMRAAVADALRPHRPRVQSQAPAKPPRAL